LKISIVIPAFNEERLIEATLAQVHASMASFTARGWDSELIVCDNNSTDRTAALACAVGAKVVFEPINQIARARNTGATAATGDWLIFIDADSHPSPELFSEVADQIAAGTCLAGGCTVRLAGDYPIANILIGFWNNLSRSLKWCAGSFIFCETAAFRKIGGFNNELFASEEIDLSKRLKILAKANHRRMVILDRYPLLTSARKLHLYTFREYMLFLARTVMAGGKTLNSREACHPWYDGRR
jgi:glycosyltransferase involved in cell wall biosynthesis